MKDGLYNRAVFWNEEIASAVKTAMGMPYTVVPTYHAYDKINRLRLPRRCYTTVLHGEVVEAQIENGQVVKVITRIRNKFEPCEDICSAVGLNHKEEVNEAVVRTIWTNAHNDNHATIKVGSYVTM